MENADYFSRYCFYCKQQVHSNVDVVAILSAVFDEAAGEFAINYTTDKVPRAIFFHHNCFELIAGKSYTP